MHIRNRNDLVLGTIILLLAVFLFHQTYLFQEVSSFSFGPRAFPRVVLGIIGLCAFIMILQNLAFGASAAGATTVAKPAKSAFGTEDKQALIMRFGMIALLIVYVAALPLVGYLPGTVAFLFLTMLLLGLRTAKHLAMYAAIAAAVAVALQYIFGTLLKFFLP